MLSIAMHCLKLRVRCSATTRSLCTSESLPFSQNCLSSAKSNNSADVSTLFSKFLKPSSTLKNTSRYSKNSCFAYPINCLGIPSLILSLAFIFSFFLSYVFSVSEFFKQVEENSSTLINEKFYDQYLFNLLTLFMKILTECRLIENGRHTQTVNTIFGTFSYLVISLQTKKKLFYNFLLVTCIFYFLFRSSKSLFDPRAHVGETNIMSTVRPFICRTIN